MYVHVGILLIYSASSCSREGPRGSGIHVQRSHGLPSLRAFAQRTNMATKWKPDVTAGDLAIACVFNTLFLTLAVADYSADLWTEAAVTESDMTARRAFLVQYLTWRNEMPIIGVVLLVLLLPLPFLLFGIYTAAVQGLFGWRKATAVRHAMDYAEACGISGVVYCILRKAVPVTEALKAACPPKSKGAANACAVAISDMTHVHLLFVLLNLVMFIAPIIKFAKGNAGPLAMEKKD